MKQNNSMAMPSMKTGDLVRVYEPRACGGILVDSIGLVISQETCQEFEQFRWTIRWDSQEKITYGYGIEVVNENR